MNWVVFIIVLVMFTLALVPFRYLLNSPYDTYDEPCTSKHVTWAKDLVSIKYF